MFSGVSTWGSCPGPCQVHSSVGVVYPFSPLLSLRHKVTPGGTTTAVAASFPALESAPTVTTTAPSPQGPGCSGGGAIGLHSSGPPGGKSVLAILCLLGLCLSQGERWNLRCVPQHPGLLVVLCCWNRAPGRAAPSTPSFCLSLLRAAPGPRQVHCSPLGSSAMVCGALSRGTGALLVSQGA